MKTRIIPSRLLIPLSFGAMMGGMLTLIATNTNLLASNISERLLGRSFGMFEYTGQSVCFLLGDRFNRRVFYL